jgi:NAD(P)H-flavin reductase
VSATAVGSGQVIAGAPTLTATVRRVAQDAADTYTFWSTFDDPEVRRAYSFLPGQIDMVGVFGVGEVPISVSSDPARPTYLAHTIRACGRVTNVFEGLRTGDRITVRGPFGRPWPVSKAYGGDLLIVGGGLGLAPLRSAVYEALRHRRAVRRVILAVGAGDPSQLLYRRQLEIWLRRTRFEELEVHLTVDRADDRWPYREGLVTALLPELALNPSSTTVFTCGPEIMMSSALRELERMGVPQDQLWLTMERNMHCAVKLCGHCQLGPWFVCADGPIFRWDEVRDLIEVDEL